MLALGSRVARHWTWPLRYRLQSLKRRLLAWLLWRRGARLLRSYLNQHNTAESGEVHQFIATLATAFGADWELATPLRDLADRERRSGRWHPDDPSSVEALTEHAKTELQNWMDEHPHTDPRDESVIDEIADSWTPVYNYGRLRVAMESSLWLIAGEVDGEATSPAEMLGVAIYEWIKDALHELADVAMSRRAEDAEMA